MNPQTDDVKEMLERAGLDGAGAAKAAGEASDLILGFNYLVTLAKAHAAEKDQPGPMEIWLEHMLDEAKKDLPDPEVATIECQIVFRDGSVLGSAVKRGPFPRTYVIASPASRTGPRGEQIPLNDTLVEVAFHGSDILRIAALRTAPPQLVVPDKRIVFAPG